jgi:hypothetical protein
VFLVGINNWQLEALKARFEIAELACSIPLMTSAPPKRRLSFELEGTHYVATVTLHDIAGQAVPARNADKQWAQ